MTRTIVRSGVRPIMWGFKDADCPQDRDIFTFEPFSELAPAAIVKFFWEYSDGTVVESCHDIWQLETFLNLTTAAAAAAGTDSPRDPHVLLEISDSMIRAAAKRITFVRSSGIAIILAELIHLYLLPKSLQDVVQRHSEWVAAMVNFSQTVPEKLVVSKLLYWAFQQSTTLWTAMIKSKEECVQEEFDARDVYRCETQKDGGALVLVPMAFICILCVALYGMETAERILQDIRKTTKIPWPSVTALIAAYIAYQSL